MIYDSEDISETYTQQSTLYIYILEFEKKIVNKFISIYLQFSYFPIFKYDLQILYETINLDSSHHSITDNLLLHKIN